MLRKLFFWLITLVLLASACENFEPCTEDTIVVCKAGFYVPGINGTLKDTTMGVVTIHGYGNGYQYFDTIKDAKYIVFPLLNDFEDFTYTITYDTIVEIIHDSIPITKPDTIPVGDTFRIEIVTIGFGEPFIDSIATNTVSDIIRFTYKNSLRLISHECGFTVDHLNINCSAPTYIDTLIILNPNVTNVVSENLRIVF